jgi:hypothetical protein
MDQTVLAQGSLKSLKHLDLRDVIAAFAPRPTAIFNGASPRLGSDGQRSTGGIWPHACRVLRRAWAIGVTNQRATVTGSRSSR